MHGSPKDDDYDRDMQLPFKTFDDCISSTAPAYVSTMLEIIVDNTIAKAEKLKRLPQNKFTLSSYLSNIWQPPKAF